MTLSDKELKHLLEQARDPVPDFEHTWTRARAAANGQKHRGWFWLIPVGAMGAAAAALILFINLHDSNVQTIHAPPSAVVAHVEQNTLDTESMAMDPIEEIAGLIVDESEDDLPLDDLMDDDNLLAMADDGDQENDVGYESPTDFLMNIEIVAWDEAEEGSVL